MKYGTYTAQQFKGGFVWDQKVFHTKAEVLAFIAKKANEGQQWYGGEETTYSCPLPCPFKSETTGEI